MTQNEALLISIKLYYFFPPFEDDLSAGFAAGFAAEGFAAGLGLFIGIEISTKM